MDLQVYAGQLTTNIHVNIQILKFDTVSKYKNYEWKNYECFFLFKLSSSLPKCVGFVLKTTKYRVFFKIFIFKNLGALTPTKGFMKVSKRDIEMKAGFVSEEKKWFQCAQIVIFLNAGSSPIESFNITFNIINERWSNCLMWFFLQSDFGPIASEWWWVWPWGDSCPEFLWRRGARRCSPRAKCLPKTTNSGIKPLLTLVLFTAVFCCLRSAFFNATL